MRVKDLPQNLGTVISHTLKIADQVVPVSHGLGQGCCILFLGKVCYSQSSSLHLGVHVFKMGIGNLLGSITSLQ